MNPNQLLVLALTTALVGCASVAPIPAAPEGANPAVSEAQVPVQALNPDVRQDSIHLTICQLGYAASVRPSTLYTNGVKLKLLRDRGLPASRAPEFELDHMVALALGGHPRNLVNLQLQPWEGEDGAKKKDQFKRKLQTKVCAGELSLAEAQRCLFYWRTGAQ